jgi:two-component system response regulator FlrC
MHRTKPVLIVHPDTEFGNGIKRILLKLKCSVVMENEDSAVPSPFRFFDYRFCIVHENFILPDGQDILASLQNEDGTVPVVIISDGADIPKAVRAIRNGAFDFFTKSSNDRVIQESLKRALEITGSPKTKKRPKKTTGKKSSPIVTRSDSMRRVLEVAQRVAPSSATVTIQGESGTGKELLARFIHQHSGRHHPFVAMNCAALPDNLAESELFGYAKGAFTGAMNSRRGKFEQAHGGTLLLDEISEMPISLQVKLLRVLQEKEVDPIGGSHPISVDVRVIATSNRDLGDMVKKGNFRQDLYYRLRVIPLTIPPLRKRIEDIELLVACFVKKHAPSHQSAAVSFSAEALRQLSSWTWPGNVRELENTVERAVLICPGSVVGPEHLLLENESLCGDDKGPHGDTLVGMTVKEMEKKLIGQTLKQVNDNRTHAAKMLGISIRTLRNKLNEYENSDLSAIDTAAAK